MSGPKVSVYDLTAEQRAIIAAELQRRLRELERRQELLTELHAFVPEVERLSKTISHFDLVSQEETIHLGSTALRTGISEVTTSIQSLTKMMSESAGLEDNTKLAKNIATIQNRIDCIKASVEDISTQATFTAERLQGVLSSSISELFAQQEQVGGEGYTESTQDMQLLTLQSYAAHKYIPESLRHKINKLLERRATIPAESIESFLAVEVQPVAKKCEEFLELWAAHGAQYELLLQRYELLAKENGRKEVTVVPFSPHAVDEIAKLVAIEEIEYQRQAEEIYIENSISSVMEEMGYNICGQREVTRRNGTHYSSSLFQYGQDSAVNVIFSDDGKITMEVGKTDHCDRIPASDESKSIVETMEAFCADFVEIERRLASKGVVLKNRIRLSPPTADFAQVINLDDFSAVPPKNAVTKKRKAAKKPKQQALES